MVLRDIETGEEVSIPYVLIRARGREAPMNLSNFNERFRAFNRVEDGFYHAIGCNFDFVDRTGERQNRGVKPIVQEFFPNTYRYFMTPN